MSHASLCGGTCGVEVLSALKFLFFYENQIKAYKSFPKQRSNALCTKYEIKTTQINDTLRYEVETGLNPTYIQSIDRDSYILTT